MFSLMGTKTVKLLKRANEELEQHLVNLVAGERGISCGEAKCLLDTEIKERADRIKQTGEVKVVK